MTMMAAPIGQMCQRYLLRFANEHTDFRLAELTALAQLFHVKLDIKDDYKSDQAVSPYWVVELPSESAAKQLISRSVLMKSVYELWGHGKTYPDMYRSSAALVTTERMRHYLSAERTFCINVETFNKTLTQQEKIDRIEELPLDIFPFQGKVKLKNPDTSLCIMEDYGKNNNQTPEAPHHVYFGRWIADSNRDQVKKFHLKDRCFLGNTSMDAGLSLLISNIAQVRRNMLVLDPFVGTGSLLVPCAYHQAYVMGTDIDYMLLHAKAKPSRHNQKKRNKDESIRANLAQYGLEKFYMDILVADASKYNMWRQPAIFDAIVTDPPYGIREGARRVGTDKEESKVYQDENVPYISQKVDYHLTDVFKDLLNFAARYLKLNGRLVYWLPVYKPDYQEQNIPTHPFLHLESNCEQPLTKKVARRLITMVKCQHCEGEDTDHTASVEVDHYSDATFRQKYFNMKPQKSKPTSSLQTTECASGVDPGVVNSVVCEPHIGDVNIQADCEPGDVNIQVNNIGIELGIGHVNISDSCSEHT